MHSFEIEGLEEVGTDWVIDIDVLPNRAHDCLSHDGIARELSGLLNLPLRTVRYSEHQLTHSDKKVSVELLNKEQCTRYMASYVSNIEVRPSPEWLKNRLESMAQKSINALVDATNYVMFDIGQPMHIFDADKVVGGITIRNAKTGETMTSLSGEEIELIESDLLICDDEHILALAGVKGGMHAEVTAETKNIIIESAHFSGPSTRKTARRVKILTDASKRYENVMTAEKTEIAMNAMIALINELAATGSTSVGNITDVYPKPEETYVLNVSIEHTARLLGFDISENEMSALLKRFDYSFSCNGGECTIIIPSERLDLRIAEDMIEEIGRLYGYHAVPVKSLDDLDFAPTLHKVFYTTQSMRNYFVDHGFTEIMNYTFVNKGTVELFNPVASDKKALRKNLSVQMKEALEKNARIVDFVNIEQVLNFEIDVVHTKDGEQTWCCFGIDCVSKKSRKKYGDESIQINECIESLKKLFSLDTLDYEQDGNIVSFNVQQCVKNVIAANYTDILKPMSYSGEARFVGISPYPYMTRDISFWADQSDYQVFETAIKNAGAEFLQKVFLFDEFEKEGRTSYAFSMIFQSFERTLTDIDVDVDMKKINIVVENLGGEIR